MSWGNQGQGWGGQGNQGWGNQGQQGWGGQQGPPGQQGWGNQGQQGWGNQGQQGWGQGQQGWGNQGPQGQQGWGNQGPQQGWGGNQGQQGGWGNQGQQWGNQQDYFNSNMEYVITSAMNREMALDVSQDPDTFGKVILWTKHGEKNQRFRLRNHNGRHVIFSSLGATMEVPQNSQENGAFILASQPNNTVNEHWEIIAVPGEEGAFYIKSFCGKSLDLCEGSTDENTPIIQWDFHGDRNQVWYIEPSDQQGS